MQDDPFPAAERIISDIVSVFKKDPKLKEFEIVPVTLNENKSPVIVQNHSLGLESWCVRHVFYHAYNRLTDIRQQRCRREDPAQVSRLLTTVLLLNPDVATFWNMRRELVLGVHLDPHSELHFTAVVLSRKPKSAEVFSYRKWLIKNLLKDFPADPGLLSNEFHVCEIAADRYPNNYYTWNHRIWCLNQFPNDSTRSFDLFISEWMNSKKWVSTHVSDHSGFQYRQSVMLKLMSVSCKNVSVLKRTRGDFLQSLHNSLQSFLNLRSGSFEEVNHLPDVCVSNSLLGSSDCDSISDCVLTPEYFILGLICSELLLSNDLILMFLGHEALWHHRRFLIYTFHNRIVKSCCRNLYEADMFRQLWNGGDSHKTNDGVPIRKDLKMEDSISESLKTLLFHFEQKLLAQCSDDFQQSKAASKHKVWLQNVLKLKF